MKDIQDFGAKIGGARKDVWAMRGLMAGDLLEMNEAEREKFIKKDNVWRKPDYQALVDAGKPVAVAYYIKCVRDSLPVAPPSAEAQDRYVQFIGDIRDAAMALETETDVATFYEQHIAPYLIRTPGHYYVDLVEGYRGLITSKVLKQTKQMSDITRLNREVKEKQFLYTPEQKVLSQYRFIQYSGSTVEFKKDGERTQMAIKYPFGTRFAYPKGERAVESNWKEGTWFVLQSGDVVGYNYPTRQDAEATMLQAAFAVAAVNAAENVTKKKGKSKYMPPQLAHVRFTGMDVRKGKNMTGNDYLKTFGFRGGEFGTWMSQKDRQESLNLGYESLVAMAKVLNIAVKDISLGGRLSIAFGARGKGGANAALAHYEYLREVINLTKMKGAGSLAHEWGHAMDDILNKANGGTGLAEKVSTRRGLTSAQIKLHQDMKTVEVHHTPEEARAKADKVRQERSGKLVDYIKYFLPSDNRLTPGQIAERDKLINAAIEDTSLRAMFSENSETIMDLVVFRKDVTGHLLPKDERRSIAAQISWYHRQIERAKKLAESATREKSEYLKLSEAFDEAYSKTDHGYWASECEMFARAFACYVHDKCTEAGIEADYIVAHADAGEPTPQGKEREILNRDFDDLICEFKAAGLLHDFVGESTPKFKPHELTEAELFEAEKWASAKNTEQLRLF